MNIIPKARLCLLLALLLLSSSLSGGCALLLRKDAPQAAEVEQAKIQLAQALAFSKTDWPQAEWWRGYND